MRKLPIRINYNIEQWLWFAIIFSLPLSIRLNSLILFISGVVLIVRSIKNPPKINRKYLLYLLPMASYFIIQVISTNNRLFSTESIKEIEQQLPLVIIPLLFILSNVNLRKFTEAILPAILSSVVFGSVIMLGESLYYFFDDYDATVFIYHRLSKPFDSGAIFFSLFIVVSLLRFNDIVWVNNSKRLKAIVFVFLVIILFMLSSKLMIVVGLIMLVLKYYPVIFGYFKENKVVLVVISIIFVIALYPVTQRLTKIADPHLDIVMDKTYTWDSPLNGLNLRLIQARYGIELLNDNHSWILGLGVDRSQKLLNAKYKKTGIYSGYEGTDDTGYQDYNFHNQYIETFVRSGLLGLIALLIILYLLVKTPSAKMMATKWEVWLLILFFLSESVLERQVGIVYFCVVYASYFPISGKPIGTNDRTSSE